MNEFSNLTNWATANVETWVFYLLAVTAIPLAFGVILDRAIIRGGFVLIGVFGAISGLFFLLQAQFLAMAQLMIYAVGITLVVVIALMLTNPRLEQDDNQSLSIHKIPALLVAILFFLTIHMAARSQLWTVVDKPVLRENVQVLGKSLMTYYSLPFEFASVLLLAALVGAVMLAKAEQGNGARGEVNETLQLQSSERSDNGVKV